MAVLRRGAQKTLHEVASSSSSSPPCSFSSGLSPRRGHQRRRRRKQQQILTNDFLMGASFALGAVVLFAVTFTWSYYFVRTLRSMGEGGTTPVDFLGNSIRLKGASLLSGLGISRGELARSALERAKRRMSELGVGAGAAPGEHPVDELKLPGPVIVVGMPKSGTTTIHSYFKCGGQRSSHFACEAVSPEEEFDALPKRVTASAVPPHMAKLLEKAGGEARRQPDKVSDRPPLGEPWRNCRLPEGAGGAASSAGDYPLCGVCVRRNIARGRPPLEGCGEYEVWSELDSAEHPLPTRLANRERKKREREEKAQEEAAKKVEDQVAQLEQDGGEEVTEEEVQELADAAQIESGKSLSDAEGEDQAEDAEHDEEEDDYGGVRPLCSYPQITHLDEIHAAYPNATFILNLRPVDNWIRSVSKWTGDRRRSGMGYLRHVLTRCDFPGLPSGKGGDDADLASFYDGHSERVREFVRQYPSHTLVEVNIEDADAGRIMEEAFGISSECWKVRNASPAAREGRGRQDHENIRRRFADRMGIDANDIMDRLRQKRRERRRSGDGREPPDIILRQRRKNADRMGGHNVELTGQRRPVDLRAEVRERQRRRREEVREELIERHDEIVQEHKRGDKDGSRRRRRGREVIMDRLLKRRGGGRSRFRYAKYAVCTDVDDLFPGGMNIAKGEK